jgi:hypothetical protein
VAIPEGAIICGIRRRRRLGRKNWNFIETDCTPHYSYGEADAAKVIHLSLARCAIINALVPSAQRRNGAKYL